MARSGPPAYAWDWFARQRLLWRETRTRLARRDGPAARRYRDLEVRSDVIALLRAEYPRDDEVRRTVDEVVTELVFLGRTDGTFAALGVTNAPRGLRWWWSQLTGEDLATPGEARHPVRAEPPATQLALDDVLDDVFEGYGG